MDHFKGRRPVIHCLHPLLSLVSVSSEGGKNYLSFAAGFFYGGGIGPGGPSLLHGMSFVIYGMLIGRLAKALIDPDRAYRYKSRLAFSLAITGLITVCLVLWPWGHPLSEPIQNLIQMVYRKSNHPLYFSIGAATATAQVWAAIEFYDVCKYRLGSSVSFIGSTSLFTFSFGNMLLVLAPRIHLAPAWALYYGLGLLLAVFLLSLAFSKSLRIGRRQAKDGQSGPLATWAIFQASIVAGIAAVTRPFAERYAAMLWPKVTTS